MKDKKLSAERLSCAIGNIDDKLIEEALNVDSPERLKSAVKKARVSRTNLIRLTSLAACIILAAGVFSVIPYLNKIVNRDPGAVESGYLTSPGDTVPEEMFPLASSSDSNAPGDGTSAGIVVTSPVAVITTPFLPMPECTTEPPVNNDPAPPTESKAETYTLESSSKDEGIESDPTDADADASYTLSFASPSELKDFIRIAGANVEAYTDGDAGAADAAVLKSIEAEIAHSILSLDGCILLKENVIAEHFEARYTYSEGADKFTVSCTVENTRFEFCHYIGNNVTQSRSSEPIAKAIPLGSRSVDLYRTDGGLFGELILENVRISVTVFTDVANADMFLCFEIVSGEDLTSTQNSAD